MKTRRTVTTLGVTCALALPASAQVGNVIDQSEALRRQQEATRILQDLRKEKLTDAPSISPDEAVDVGPQAILRSKEYHRWFAFDVDTQLYWTDNMYFETTNKVSSSVLASSAQFSLTPPQWNLGEGKLRPRLGYQHVWMNHALLGARFANRTGTSERKLDSDFDVSSVFGDLSYSWGKYQAQVGLDWQRLLSHQPSYTSYQKFYRDYSPRWSLSRFFEYKENHGFVVAYLGSYHFTSVQDTGLDDGDRNNRTEHNLLLNYSYRLTPRLIFQPGYRFQFTHYSKESPLDSRLRMDQLHSFSGSVIVPINNWLMVRAYAAYELRESNSIEAPDYRKLDSGVGLSASFRF